MKKLNNKGFSAIETILIFIIVALIGFIGWYVYNAGHDSESNSPSSIIDKVKGKKNSPMVLSYESKTGPKKFIVTDTSNKILTELEMSENKNTFEVIAKGSENLILKESYRKTVYSADEPGSSFISVDYKGNSEKLPESSAKLLSESKPAGSGTYLADNNTAVYVKCDDTSCILNKLNLTSGAKSEILTKPYKAVTFDSSDSSMYLMGVDDNIAFLLEDSQQKPGSIHKYNMATKKDTASYPLTTASLNTPVISNDYKKAIYTSHGNNGTHYLVNLLNGKIDTIKTNFIRDSEDFKWSPDNQKIAYTINGPTEAKSDAQLVYLDISDKNVTPIKSLGDSDFNLVSINSWLSNTDISYRLDKTKVANTFLEHGTDFKIKISGDDSEEFSPTGYKSLTPLSNVVFFSIGD